MHTVFLTRKFPPAAGGMETFSAALTHHFAGEKTVAHYSTQPKDIWWVAPVLLFRGLFLSRRASLYHIGDLVLAPIGALLKLLTHKPVVATVHALELTYPNERLRRLIDRSLPRIDQFVAVSRFAASLLEQRGVPKEKISVIPHGVTPPHSEANDPIQVRETARKKICAQLSLSSEDCREKLIITTIGRLVPRKGVAWFLEHVLPSLLHLNVLYLVASDGPERNRIEQLIAEKKLEQHARLLGRVDAATIRALYDGSDLFVMPNIAVTGDAEGFGFVAIEAAAAGLPVLAANIDGIPDAIHHEKNGLLLQTQNAHAFIDAITYWALHPVQRRAFGQHAQRYTREHFRWEDVAARYQQLFNHVYSKTRV